MLKYVGDNIAYATNYLKERLPEIKFTQQEGTYLLWLDFRPLKLSESQLEELIIKKAKLQLDSGRMFGVTGSGFQRINIACPRETLKEALTRLERAIRED